MTLIWTGWNVVTPDPTGDEESWVWVPLGTAVKKQILSSVGAPVAHAVPVLLHNQYLLCCLVLHHHILWEALNF